MRWIIFSLILLASALLDAGNLLNSLALGSLHIKPAIVVIVTVFACLNTRRQDAIRCAFAAGLAADIVSGIVGPHMICYGILGTILNGMNRTLSTRHFFNQMLIVVLFYIVAEFPAVWLDAVKTGEHRQNIFSTILFTGLYSSVLTPMLWRFLSALWGQMGRRSELRPHLR